MNAPIRRCCLVSSFLVSEIYERHSGNKTAPGMIIFNPFSLLPHTFFFCSVICDMNLHNKSIPESHGTGGSAAHKGCKKRKKIKPNWSWKWADCLSIIRATANELFPLQRSNHSRHFHLSLKDLGGWRLMNEATSLMIIPSNNQRQTISKTWLNLRSELHECERRNYSIRFVSAWLSFGHKARRTNDGKKSFRQKGKSRRLS